MITLVCHLNYFIKTLSNPDSCPHAQDTGYKWIEKVHLSDVRYIALSIGVQFLVGQEQCIIQSIFGTLFHARVYFKQTLLQT